MTSNVQHNWWFNQLFTKWKPFEIIYVGILILLQIGVYLIAPDSWVGMLSGVAGTLCLVYGMKGRKISFVFGIVQCLAMTYVAWISHAYGSFAMDIFYVISQPIGWFMWGHDEATHTFSRSIRSYLFIGAFLAWLVGPGHTSWSTALFRFHQLRGQHDCPGTLHSKVPGKLVPLDCSQHRQYPLLGHSFRSSLPGD